MDPRPPRLVYETEVKQLSAADRMQAARWDAFVLGSPDATFFHRAGWQRVIGRVFRHPTYFLYAQTGDVVTGVLPLVHVKSLLFGNALVSLPFAVYGGVAASTPEASAALESEALALAERLRVDHLELRNVRRRHEDWPLQDLYVTFRKEILPDLEANMLAIPRKQRAMVRKGIKNGLRSEVDNDVARFFELFADNVHRHGTPALPKRYFEALTEEFASDCEILSVTDSGGRALSSVMSFRFRDEILPYYAGDDERARELAANDFKYWEVMRRACESGVHVFDYGRSKRDTGSYAFKKNWGFEPTQLYYEYKLVTSTEVPDTNPLNPKYQLMIRTWQKMPLALANLIGPHIVKNLG